nr:MAG TPA: hypothetical protein [Caudoviricetes sp.]
MTAKIACSFVHILGSLHKKESRAFNPPQEKTSLIVDHKSLNLACSLDVFSSQVLR